MVNPANVQRVELKQQTFPRVRTEEGRILVTLELTSVVDVGYPRDIELVLTPKNAAVLGAELAIAIQKFA